MDEFQFLQSPPKHSRWKSNPHPDNIVLPRKKPPVKKTPKDVHAIDPDDLIFRLEKHAKELKLRENGLLDEPLREMDWERIRRAQRPSDRSRMSSRLEIRKEPARQEPIIESESDLYMDPRRVPPRNETEAIEQYASELYSAYRDFRPPPRADSSATGSFERYRCSPARKESNAETFDTISVQSSRTSSRSSFAAPVVTERVKSFQGLPPLFFQLQDGDHLNTETTLSLESGADKPESIFSAELARIETFGAPDLVAPSAPSAPSIADTTVTTSTSKPEPGPSRNTFGTEAARQASTSSSDPISSNIHPAFRKRSSTLVTDPNSETIPIGIRQSALPVNRSHSDAHSSLQQTRPSTPEIPTPMPMPILTYSQAPSQTPPQTRVEFTRGRGLSPGPPPLRRSVSSEETYKPLAESMTIQYRRASRPESWGPETEELSTRRSESTSGGGHNIDSYYFRESNSSASALAAVGLGQIPPPPPQGPPPPQYSFIPAIKHDRAASADTNSGIKRLFGPKIRKLGSSKDLPSLPDELNGVGMGLPVELAKPIKPVTDKYNLPGMLPDDFPVQRKNFLSLFKK